MCHNIGALVLAEGVEQKDEIISCMKKDIDIFQGFWFSKPQSSISKKDKSDISQKIEVIGNEFKLKVQKSHKRRKNILKKIKNIIKDKFEDITLDVKNLDDELSSLLLYYEGIEAVYVLDYELGIQKGETYISTSTRSFYKPTKDGHDHSLKEYFYITKESTEGEHLGKKYISKASGNSCVTYSVKINIEDKNFIICFDLVGKYISY